MMISMKIISMMIFMMKMCKQAWRQVVRYYDDYTDYYNSDDDNLNDDNDDDADDNDNIIHVIYKGRSKRNKSRR